MNQTSLAELAAQIPSGARLAVPPTRSGAAISATRLLIEQGVRDLHLVAVPTSGLQADMLIGAGCVKTVESAGITLDEQGQAPRFVDAVKNANIELMDTTCPALISALQAGEKGIPFIPMRGLIGSDLLANRADYRVVDNPMADAGDPIVLLPAIVPDVALFHAPIADRYGNVWIGRIRELMTLAHAARQTLVSVEEIVDYDLMQDELRAPATIPAHYISQISVAHRGCWPLPLPSVYEADAAGLAAYASAAQTPQGFARYLAETGDTVRQAAAS